MTFPSLKTARVLNEVEMLSFRGGACNSGCKSGCSSSCKTGCSPGEKNNNSGNGNTVSPDLGLTKP